MTDIDLTRPVESWLPTLLYPGFRPGLPDICLGRLPERMAAMAGHPYKSWILENPKEHKLLKQKLAEPLPVTDDGRLDFISGPDAAVRKTGRGASATQPVIAIYSPQMPGWPHLVLVSMPFRDPQFERGCYAWEVFERPEDAVAHSKTLIAQLGLPVDAPSIESFIQKMN